MKRYMSLKRAIQNWYMKEVGTLATKIGKLVKKSEIHDPKVGKFREVGKLVKKSEMDVPKVEKVGNR